MNYLLSPFFMLFFHLYKIFFFTFCFPIYNVYPKYCQSYKKMSFNENEDFTFENYYKRIGFSKENSYYSMNRLKKKGFIVASKQINRKNT